MLFKHDAAARAQHLAVRNNAGWYRWKHDLLEVRGSAAAAFLDRVYVNSIARTGIGRSKYTTMLDENGGIIDDVIVMRMDRDLFWVSTLYLPELMEWIEPRKAGLDLECRDITGETEMYAVQGPNSRALMNRIVSAPVDELKYFSSGSNTAGGAAVTVHRSGFTGELGYEIYCASADAALVESALKTAGAEMGAVNLDILEVYVRSLPGEKGYVLRQDILGLNPMEADMGFTVDMSKEFIGKKALEKAIEEGPKRKLVGLEYETDSYSDISQGEAVRIGGVKVGTVTASMYGYTIERNIGYAVVDRSRAAVGDRARIGANGIPARIVERMWYDPENKRPRS